MTTTAYKDFKQYVLSFYGKGGLYEFDCPHAVIIAACVLVQHRKDGIPFEGDTVDREAVRAVLEKLGHQEIKRAA